MVVIKNGRFQSVGESGTGRDSSGAKVVDTRGLTPVAGLYRRSRPFRRFSWRALFHLGITTCATIETTQDGPWTLAQRDGTNAGQDSRAPASGRRAALSEDRAQPLTRRSAAPSAATSPSRRSTRRKRRGAQESRARGFDVIKLNEFASFDLVRAVAEEAHANGMGVTAHSWDVIESVKAGVDGIEHIWSVGYSSILDVKEGASWPSSALPEISSRSSRAPSTRSKTSTPSSRSWSSMASVDADHCEVAAPVVAARRSASGSGKIRSSDNPKANLPPAVRAVADSAYDKL